MLRLIIFSTIYSTLCVVRGLYPALWLMCPIAFLFAPAWHYGALTGSLQFTYVGAMALITVIAMLLTSSNQTGPAVARKKFVLTDLVIALIPICNCITIANNGELSPLTLPSMGIQVLPYVVGRIYLRRTDDLQDAMRPIVVACAILCPIVIAESMTGINPFRLVLDHQIRSILRHGYTRATGACANTHDLGLYLLLFTPWLLEARRRSRLGIAPRWWRFAPAFNLLSSLATLSRGPILAIFSTMWINQFFQRQNLRKLILAVTLLGGFIGYFLQDDIQWYLMAFSGETELFAEKSEIITIDGEEHVYTGSTHRILLYKVWRNQMETSGMFGYDSNFERPNGQLWKFWSIDNNYIYTRVRRGWVGLQLFNLLVLLTLYRTGRLALSEGRCLAPFAGSLFSAVATFALSMFTVSCGPTLAVGFYFFVGLAATVCSLPEPEPSHDEWWDDESQWDDEEFESHDQ